jgi:hypothetical protein
MPDGSTKESVERDGIASPEIGEHSHGERKPERGGSFASDERDERLPSGQRERSAQSPGRPPARRPQRTGAETADPAKFMK